MMSVILDENDIDNQEEEKGGIIEEIDVIEENQVSLFKNNESKLGGSFVGSPFYVSPEMIQTSTAFPESDFWGLGCIIYRLFYGSPPFADETEYLMYERVKNNNYKFPDISEINGNSDLIKAGNDLITQFLQTGVKNRLTDVNELKKHPFFNGVYWD